MIVDDCIFTRCIALIVADNQFQKSVEALETMKAWPQSFMVSF